MAKKGGTKGYFGLGWGISLILAIIPITSWICGVITSFQRGHVLWGVVRIFLGFNIFWIIDLVCMIVSKKIWILC